jgi:hypothetical protein
MPSLPPRDGVDALLCAGIHAGTSTISPVDSLSGVAGKSLPPSPTGEHDALGGPGGTFLSPPRAIREHGGGMSSSGVARLLVWVDGTLAQLILCWVVNAIIFPSPSQKKGGGIFPDGSNYYAIGKGTPSSHPTAIVEWAACASVYAVYEYAREILEYWDANASPHEQTICNEENAGPPLSSPLPIRERLLANEQSEVRRDQWVCTYLAMSVSPSHPHHHMGGARVRWHPHLPFLLRCQAHRRARCVLLHLLI